MNWIDLTENTLPPADTLVWVERYSSGTRGIHHAIYLGSRRDLPLTENLDPSRDCYWHGRAVKEDLYVDMDKGGLQFIVQWSDATVKRWAAFEAPDLPKQ